ncbi:MAG: hypothetical protein DMF64_20105 [Acidobacteria bacterium]|nr:MAG: hypothetical protein DMF64_20105 [Acidobacteriota bacterium]
MDESCYWRTGLLGAFNALAYSGVLHLAEKLSDYQGWPRHWWSIITITITLVVFFTLASYLVHRLWLNRIKSLFPLWLSIGVMAVAGWNTLGLVLAYYEKYTSGFTVVYNEVTALRNPMFGLFSLVLLIGTNLIFAAVVSLAAKSYTGGSLR